MPGLNTNSMDALQKNQHLSCYRDEGYAAKCYIEEDYYDYRSFLCHFTTTPCRGQ
jgi:hypothetical protein